MTNKYAEPVRLLSVSDPVNPDLSAFIDWEHHQVHEGEMFSYSYLISSLSSGVNQDFRLVVPVYSNLGRTPHIVFEAIATAETELYFYENTTFSGNGTAQSKYNRNRNIAAGPGMGVFLSPTVSALGTLLWVGLLGANNRTGSAERALTEWILKSNTSYLFRVTSRAASDKIVFRANWYEDVGV